MDIKGIDKRAVKIKLKNAMPIIVGIAQFAIGFLLARGLVFKDYAPFGIAWCAVGGTAGTIGAILGYISILYKANGLKYMAICILLYTAGRIFSDTHMVRKRYFMPLIAMVCTASVGFVFVPISATPLKTGVFYVAEVLLSGICAYFYALAHKGKNRRQRRVGMALLITTLILPLSFVRVFGLSLGKILGMSLVLILGYFGGVGAGSSAGIILTFATGGGSASIYGICGLVAPLFRDKGKYTYISAFLLLGASAALWTAQEINSVFICEGLLATSAFLAVCRFYGDKVASFFENGEKKQTGEKLQNYLWAKLDAASEAFYELSLIFSGKKEESKGEFASVFEAPIQKVCKKCALAKNCWETEFVKTKDALYNALLAIESKGELEIEDFPCHFASRCIKVEEFVKAANDELFKVLYRKKYKAQIKESRDVLKRQYVEMSKIMANFKSEIKLSFDRNVEAKITDFLEKNEISAYPTAYRDRNNRLGIEIEGERLSRFCNEEFSRDLSAFIGVDMKEPVFDCDHDSITIREKEKLKVILGASLNKKKGNKVSGDAGSYYRTDEGGLALILADGMGSGAEAANISSSAVKMAERFHRAKIDIRMALSAINTALALKEDGAFTTIDFMEMDLYCGRTKLYKLGSAPTYLRHKGEVQKISCSSLPAGVPSPDKNLAEYFEFQVCERDFLVFVTDGITDNSDDDWIIKIISDYRGESARELAAEIIATAAAKHGDSDDMSVFTVYVDKNH